MNLKDRLKIVAFGQNFKFDYDENGVVVEYKDYCAWINSKTGEVTYSIEGIYNSSEDSFVLDMEALDYLRDFCNTLVKGDA